MVFAPPPGLEPEMPEPYSGWVVVCCWFGVGAGQAVGHGVHRVPVRLELQNFCAQTVPTGVPASLCPLYISTPERCSAPTRQHTPSTFPGMRYDELAAREGLHLDDVMAVIARRRWPLDLDAGQVEVVRREAAERAEVIAEVLDRERYHP